MKRTSFRLTALLLLCACQGSHAPTPDEVVAAERAFAEDGYNLGFKASFLKHSADDAIVLQPGPVNAHESLSAQPDLKAGEVEPKLVWWPLYAGISKSGDLGFTTGPFEYAGKRGGHYFTVWKRQADGGWKWVIDAGVEADSSAEPGQGSDVAFLPTANSGAASPEAAMAEVAALEKTIADRARRGLAASYTEFLDADSRLHSAGPPPATTLEGRDAVFAARPETIALAGLGGGASKGGDLVWTYGEGRWRDAGGDRIGHYVRVWQRRPAGWRLIFDELVPAPAAPPAE